MVHEERLALREALERCADAAVHKGADFLPQEAADLLDKGYRYLELPNVASVHILEHFRAIARCFVRGTEDDSMGELEKAFAAILTRMLLAEARLRAQQETKHGDQK